MCLGELPKKRVQRKCEQLESMAQAVCRIACPGDVIVDFCSGGVGMTVPSQIDILFVK